jgi:c-di-GMP-related signal transduction protein
MNNLKKVYKHLNKEELSTQKVELALVDDVLKENKRIVEIYDRAVRDSKDAADLLQRVSSMYSKNSSKIDNAIKKAKELGANDIEKKLLQAKSISDKYEAEAKTRAKKIFSL